ncbi:MAG TPA: hypothetical protein VI076_10400 [Actinopolymorphaceae bacterium]
MPRSLRPHDPRRLGPYPITARLGEGGQVVVADLEGNHRDAPPQPSQRSAEARRRCVLITPAGAPEQQKSPQSTSTV